ncbi:MAG: hypothetical protein KDI04_14835 [Halieaceae bacterium]|nr:hypothetical protein [Halieaceae bacterium]MCP5148650.1 hypothetical protein [Pseudomonadales bacterium]MCP5188052.1 hypothetical protein [Pseudomonadales bacterium]
MHTAPLSLQQVSRAAAALALLLALAVVEQGFSLFQRDLAFTAAETEVSFWGEGNYQPTAAKREWVGQQVGELLAEAPGHPEYQLLAASYYAWQAYWAEDPKLEQQYTHKGQQAREYARQSRPAYVYNEAGATEQPD